MRNLFLTASLLLSATSLAGTKAKVCEQVVNRELKQMGFGTFNNPSVNKSAVNPGFYVFSGNENVSKQQSGSNLQVYEQSLIDGSSWIHIVHDRLRLTGRKSIHLDGNCMVKELIIGDGLSQLTLNEAKCKDVVSLYQAISCPGTMHLKKLDPKMNEANFSKAVIECSRHSDNFGNGLVPLPENRDHILMPLSPPKHD
jgi:hypothetical protein